MELKAINTNPFIFSANIVVPVILSARPATNSSGMLKKELIKLNSTFPIINDIWLKRAIGLESGRISYVNMGSNEKFLVDLSRIIDCSILLNSDEIVIENRDISSANTLDIVLVEKGLKNKFVKMNFYDTHQDKPVQASHRLQLAMKWKKIIFEKIQSKKTITS